MNPDWLATNVRAALACGADPAMALCVALASCKASTVAEALDFLNAQRALLLAAADEQGSLTLGDLPAELRLEPEPARMRLEQGDHEIRGHLVFGELLGQKSFFQVAALEIAGLTLSESDAELLEKAGIVAQLADVRIWPLTVVRRVTLDGNELAHSLIAGLATLCTSKMAVRPVGGFIEFLDRAEAARGQGTSSVEFVRGMLQSRERILGVGRPALRGDERIRPQLEICERYGRLDGPSMKLTRELDACLTAEKGLSVNGAGYQGALMRDLGFSAEAAAAFCLLYFLVPVLTQRVHAAEKISAR